jgi:hypothetical protein
LWFLVGWMVVITFDTTESQKQFHSMEMIDFEGVF